jgi:hypothetical protein
MEQILHLEETDDITSIKSRIDFVLPTLTRQSMQNANQPQRPRLLLVIPRKNKALHNLVNMKVLARSVKNRAVELAVVSNNPAVRDNAKIADVKRFSSVRGARRAGWVTAQTPEAAPETSLPPITPAAADPTQQAVERGQKRVKKKKYVVVAGDRPAGSFKYIAQQLGMLILIVILAGILAIGFIGLLPEATVTITPVAQPVEAELIVKADPEAESVDFTSLTFPARKEQVELSMTGEIETVKTELTPFDRAGGRVSFINRTEDRHIIPISTTVATAAGTPVEFVTTVTATIPAGLDAVTTTSVIAVEPGPRGNVGAGQINRFVDPAFGLLARVVNESPTSGGTLAPARIIEEADKPRLDAHLQQIIQQEGLAQIQASLAEQEFIPPESVQVIVLDKKYDDFSGDFSDTFSGQMQAVVRTTVIGGYNANRLALAALEAQVPPGYELDIEGLQFGAGEILSIDEGIVTFRIFASGQALPVIDDRQVAEAVAWLPLGDAQSRLSQQYDLATVPGIELGPEWLAEYLGRLPFSPLRITVNINAAVTPVADEG